MSQTSRKSIRSVTFCLNHLQGRSPTFSSINSLVASPQEILAAAKDKDFKLAGCGLFAQVLVLIEPGIALKICDEPGEASEVEKDLRTIRSSSPDSGDLWGM
jgi:hypothetical protein